MLHKLYKDKLMGVFKTTEYTEKYGKGFPNVGRDELFLYNLQV